MAMELGGGGGFSNLNVTPMIDILLVLLVIFMIIVPIAPKGESAQIPQPPPPHSHEQTPQRTIVVQVIKNRAGAPTLKINQQTVAWNDLQSRLTDIYKTRAQKVMFLSADKSLPWTDIAQIIDIAHASGVDKVGLLSKPISAAGQNG
jgi:biopolymer transport protein TolR